MQIILVRHGESEGNIKEHVYGRTDYPLTDKGRSQIPHIIEGLKHFDFDEVYTSPLCRASAIGEAVALDRDIPIHDDDRLMEINFGDYEDRHRSDVMSVLGDDYYKLIGFLDHYDIPNGEQQDDFLKRVQSFIDELMEKEPKTYVITAHFGVIKAVLNYLMGYDKKMLRQLAIKPGAIVKLTVKKDRVRLDELVQTFDRV